MYSSQDRVGIVVVCRLKSVRLPKKALLHIGGYTVLHRCFSQCVQSGIEPHRIVLATSTHEQDDELVDAFRQLQLDDCYLTHCKHFRGSEDNVAERIIAAANMLGLRHIVRVTGDSPFVSYELMKTLIDSHIEHEADYTAFKNCALGLQSEVISLSSLHKLHKSIDTSKSEFLTLYYRHNPTIFKTLYLDCPVKIAEGARFNLDYPEDYVFLNEVYTKTYSFVEKQRDIRVGRIAKCVNDNPDLLILNKHKFPVYKDVDVQEFILR